MNYVYEIVDALNEYYNKSPFEVLTILDELYGATDEKDFKEEADRICEEYKICPKCHYSFLNGVIKDENEIELIGSNDIPTGWCPDCGWGIENGESSI